MSSPRDVLSEWRLQLFVTISYGVGLTLIENGSNFAITTKRILPYFSLADIVVSDEIKQIPDKIKNCIIGMLA